MTERRRKQRRFRRLLHSFEDVVDEPIFPGEAQTWCETIRGALETVKRAMPASEENNKRIYDQILEAHVEMAHAVAQLKASDGRLRIELDDLEHRLAQLFALGEDSAWVSDDVLHDANTLRMDLLYWIARCRAHEQEVVAWLVESFYRESGPVD